MTGEDRFKKMFLFSKTSVLDGEASSVTRLLEGDCEPLKVESEPEGPMRRTLRNVVKISSSVNNSKGSRLFLIVPLNRVGSVSLCQYLFIVYADDNSNTLRDDHNIITQVL